MAGKSGVRVKGLKEIQRNFLKFSRIIGQGRRKPFEAGGKYAVKVIRRRTLSGVDFKGNKFASYNPKYKKKTGNKTVNLHITGKMMNALSFQAFAKKVRIYVKKKPHGGKISTYGLAVVQNYRTMTGRKHKAVNPSREFMGLTEQDITNILKIVEKFYLKELANVF